MRFLIPDIQPLNTLHCILELYFFWWFSLRRPPSKFVIPVRCLHALLLLECFRLNVSEVYWKLISGFLSLSLAYFSKESGENSSFRTYEIARELDYQNYRKTKKLSAVPLDVGPGRFTKRCSPRFRPRVCFWSQVSDTCRQAVRERNVGP